MATRENRQLRERAVDVKGLLERNTPQARQILRKLLEGKLNCTPVREEGSKGYQISGKGSYQRLLPASLVLPTIVASPNGFSTSREDDFAFTFNVLAKAG